VKKLCHEFPSSVAQSVSCTTRKPRSGEIDGVDYYFIDEKQFMLKLQKNEFIEHAKVFHHYYGTLSKHVEDLVNKGFIVLLVIDVQGALQLKKVYKADYIFIAPPSMEELKRRIEKRSQDAPFNMEERLKVAVEEMKHKDLYDFVIVNDNFDTAYQQLKAIIIGEENGEKIKSI